MKDKLAKLINVKSIITLILCAVFAYLSALGHNYCGTVSNHIYCGYKLLFWHTNAKECGCR